MRHLILAILPLLFIVGCKQADRTEILQTKVDSLQTKVDSLQFKNDSLSQGVRTTQPESNYWFNADYDGDVLVDSGIPNPAEFVETEFRKRTDLIPTKAVMGGTMRFGTVQLLSREWLIADFDDGHIQGRALYSYKLNDTGQLEFKLLNAIQPE